jgi:GT2 family glycosyltransferase
MGNMKSVIIAIRYLEPSWNETLKCIQETGYPYVIIDRLNQGTGSLAEAINRGVASVGGFDWAWIVTNITFDTALAKQFLESTITDYAAIHPEFDSDHPFLRSGSPENKYAPYIEFTAALVRLEVMRKFPLDELMPYWGHDLDWGHRVRAAGMKMVVYRGFKVEHTYIRHSKPHPITQRRHQLRRATDHRTIGALIRKYGPNWKTSLHYDGWN